MCVEKSVGCEVKGKVAGRSLRNRPDDCRFGERRNVPYGMLTAEMARDIDGGDGRIDERDEVDRLITERERGWLSSGVGRGSNRGGGWP